jgi:drug/metabolite transporter (DMT)-like permease
MNLGLTGLFALAIGGEIGRELCFKAASHTEIRRSFLSDIFCSPMIWLGLLISGVQITSWLLILQRAPLSFAFPLMSLCYCGMVLASRVLLHEPVPRTRWLGAGLITIGVAIIGSIGGGVA